MNKIEEKLCEAYSKYLGYQPDKIIKITGTGSSRNYFRLMKDSTSIIGVFSYNIPENNTFIYFSEIFTSLNLNTPKLKYIAEDKSIYFIEDLGDSIMLDTILSISKNEGFNDYLIDLYKKSLDKLVEMQIKSADKLDFDKTYSIREFKAESILFDLNFFKYYFLNRCEIPYDEKLLQDDFNKLANQLSKGKKYFMFRDFQTRNIIIKDNEPYFIDYQGGRLGAPEYDLASILYQAKAGIPEKVKILLRDYYFQKLSSLVEIEKDDFDNKFYSFVYLRILQTLGVYGLRGLIENKEHFIESIPFALSNLKKLIEERPILNEYSELSRILKEISETKMFDKLTYPEFTLRVYSFSYKKGLPKDQTGNGGGFIFDCRGINNPGRHTEYKKQTGKDAGVIDFLKKHSNIDEFVKNSISITKPSIENYIERGFNTLMVCFGCTGGQHRSVYSAESFAKYYKENYNISVELIHREWGSY